MRANNDLLQVAGGPLHVVYVADIPTSGGATDCLVELASGVQERFGFKATVLTAQHSRLNERLDALGVENFVTEHGAFLFAPPSSKLRGRIAYMQNRNAWRRGLDKSISLAEKYVDFSKVDVIHSNLPRTDLGELLASKHGIAHICHLREFSFTHFGCISFRKDPVRFISDHSDCLVAISRSVGEGWVEKGADPEKVRVIYDDVSGRDLTCLAAGERRCCEAHDKLEMVFLGGCSETKGVWDAIHAAEKLSASRPVHLDVYGYDSRATNIKVHSYVKTHGIGELVSLKNYDPDVMKSLHRYDVALVCSKAEGFGRVVIEYWAAGVPVVASNTGALPELITPGVNGLLYDKAQGSASLAEQISLLADDAGLRGMLVGNGRASVERFDQFDSLQAIADLYREVSR